MAFNKKKNMIFKFIALSLVAVTVLTNIPMSEVSIQAASVSDIEDKIEQLEQEQDKISAEKDKLEDEISSAQDKQQAYQNEIDTVKQQLNLYQDKITVIDQSLEQKNKDIEKKESEIKDKEAEIEVQQVELDETYEVFKERLNAIYMASADTSILSVVFGVASFSEFLTMSETLKTISENDNQLMEDLEAKTQDLELSIQTLDSEMEVLKQEKIKIDEEKKDLEATKAEFSAKSDELNALYKESSKITSNLESAMTDMEKAWLDTEKQINASQDEIEKILQQAEADRKDPENESPQVETPSAAYIQPVKSGYISSPYGYRWGTLHTGIDIAAPNGTPIYATKAGKVISVKYLTYSYGYHLILDHGDGTYSLYAHTSAMYVSVGDIVKQGEKIAAVGSTGNSTGNHLHFEIRTGTSIRNAVNPAKYINFKF